MTRAVFQAGVRWSQIAQHWDAYAIGLCELRPAQVAAFDTAIDDERILAQEGVLRVPRKESQATIANARALIAHRATSSGAFAPTSRSFSDYAALARDMRKRFAFLGDMNVWYVLFRCGRTGAAL